jgi:hypothetical protein
MDKIHKIAAAALFASGVAIVTPALAVQTTAENFVGALSSDFSRGNLGTALAKLSELKRLGITGIMFDRQQVSVDQLIALLTDIQAGNTTGSQVSASLLAYLQDANSIRFVKDGVLVAVADLNVTGAALGTQFPAGSAG